MPLPMASSAFADSTREHVAQNRPKINSFGIVISAPLRAAWPTSDTPTSSRFTSAYRGYIDLSRSTSRFTVRAAPTAPQLPGQLSWATMVQCWRDSWAGSGAVNTRRQRCGQCAASLHEPADAVALSAEATAPADPAAVVTLGNPPPAAASRVTEQDNEDYTSTRAACQSALLSEVLQSASRTSELLQGILYPNRAFDAADGFSGTGAAQAIACSQLRASRLIE